MPGATSLIQRTRSSVWEIEIGVSARTASESPWIKVQEIGEKKLDSPARLTAMGRREDT